MLNGLESTVRFRKGSTMKKIIFLSFSVTLMACGPSAEEVKIRSTVENDVKEKFYNLPHPNILEGFSQFLISGNYHGQYATIHAEYRTDGEIEKICNDFREVLNERIGFETSYSARGECKENTYGNRTFYTINGKNSELTGWIDFGVSEERIGEKIWKKIEIWLTSASSRSRWAECVANDSGKVKSECESVWSGRIDAPKSNKGQP
ncbi:hypothetical protein HDN1F_29620 [gamma proteobacterium HdN1]|nr:hypothetical protein HDN1F_29620 [gamma proteobacterium HdN1]